MIGYTKGLNYHAGQACPSGSEWCRVYVNGHWRFIDPNFGQTDSFDDSSEDDHLPSKRDAPPNVKLSQDKFYCFTDPAQFIYDHYVKAPADQLLARPVTYDEFKEMVFLRKAFFELGFKNTSEPRFKIESRNGEASVIFTLPDDSALTFKYEFMKYVGMNMVKEKNGIVMNSFVTIKTELNNKNENEKQFHVDLKYPGRHCLRVWAKDPTSSQSVWSPICDHLIYSHTPKYCQPGLDVSGEELGPLAVMGKLGITPVTTDQVIYPEDGMVSINLKVSKDAPLDFHHKLQYKTGTIPHLQKFAGHYRTAESVVFVMKVPRVGHFTMKLFANENDKSDIHICTYLIVCHVPSQNRQPYPLDGNGHVGALLQDTGLLAISHKHAFFDHSDPDTLQMELHCASTDMNINVALTARSDNYKTITRYDDYIMTERDDEHFKLKINFPRHGIYNLRVLVTSKDDSEEDMVRQKHNR